MRSNIQNIYFLSLYKNNYSYKKNSKNIKSLELVIKLRLKLLAMILYE